MSAASFSMKLKAEPSRPILLIRVLVLPPLVQKLRTRDDRFHQAAKRIPVRYQLAPHGVEGSLVGVDQTSPQTVGQELPTQVIDKVILPPVMEILAQSHQPGAVLAIGERRRGVHWPGAQVPGAAFADWSIVLEDEADRIKAAMAARAALV